MKKLSIIAVAVSASLFTMSAHAAKPTEDGWSVNGYGHLKYDLMESHDLSSTWAHRRDYRAAGAAFSGNPNQVEFTVKKSSLYENGAWANYVLKTEYGNNEGGNGDVYYGSSGGNEGHLESGQLEFKEAYVELGGLASLPDDAAIWTGRRYLNREAGIITKEYWKQSSGVGAGIEKGKFGFAVLSADAGDGYCDDGGETVNGRNCKDAADGSHTTLTTFDAYLYGVEALGGSFNFDAKYMTRVNTDDMSDDAAEDGVGLGITYKRDFYGFDGWSTTGVTYGKGIAGTKGVNFGSWSGDWNKEDRSLFITSYGVAEVNDKVQIGTEFVYWNLENQDGGQIWGTDELTRVFIGATPSYKVNDNFRLEATFTYSIEDVGEDGTWSREDAATSFASATIAPVFTVNADYWGRPQIKPYLTYMTSSDDNYKWGSDAKGDETRVGIEAEIWF
ncbi:carbohydrate porin [Vibrio crassostreae]|uniref:carbohydrate porin n=1 Tax=Vibrio crassostreae TaxID=246167 RepID=UPI001B30585F|nr:carbohydrate porin [Vibrio crassostreae]